MVEHDADVIVVGAGPVGLLLAAELSLAGVRPVVLERHAQPRTTPKAGGLGGQILELLRYRGLLDRFRAISPNPDPAPRFPFGGVHVDLTTYPDPPLHAMALPQPTLERLLEDRARELGGTVSRGSELIGFTQNDDAVTATVQGPDGPYEITARYLVGCDGGRSRVRELAGIPFPGTTYPEVNRVGQVRVAGDGPRLDVGFTHTERGMFAFGGVTNGVLMAQTVEAEPAEYDDDEPMSLDEFRASVRRVIGVDIPMQEPLRLSRWQFKARHAERYRDGRVLLAGDAAHLLPATGAALNLGLTDALNLAWKLGADVHGRAPEGLLDTYASERRAAGTRALLQTQAQVALRRGTDPAADALRDVVQELLADEQPARRLAALIAGADTRYPDAGPHPLTGTVVPGLDVSLATARPVLLDLADRPDLREAARGRVDVVTAVTADRPADVLLLRPDATVAWAATGPADPNELTDALTTWFGAVTPDAAPR